MNPKPIPRKELLLIALLAPLLGLVLGGIYAYPAMKVTKEREPWLTLALSVGLGVTVFGIGWICQTATTHLLLEWAAAVVMLLLVRTLFGLRGNLEHFGMVHVTTLCLVLLVAALTQHVRLKPALHAEQGADRVSGVSWTLPATSLNQSQG